MKGEHKYHTNSNSYKDEIILELEVKSKILSFFMILTKEKTNSIFSVVQVYICMNIILTILELITQFKRKKKQNQSIVCYGDPPEQVGVNFVFCIEANHSPHTV